MDTDKQPADQPAAPTTARERIEQMLRDGRLDPSRVRIVNAPPGTGMAIVGVRRPEPAEAKDLDIGTPDP